jgi:hypothetical protein
LALESSRFLGEGEDKITKKTPVARRLATQEAEIRRLAI